MDVATQALTQEIVIKVTGTTQAIDQSNEDLFTQYNLQIKYDGSERKTSRRFREFRGLNDALLREFAFTPLPAFPFNAWAEMFIGSNYLVSSRIFELEKWLNAVAAIPKVCKSHFFLLFLSLYDLSDKVAVVTGSNTGIGKEAATSLAANGCQVILACRNTQKAEQAAAEIRKKTGNNNVTSMQLDLSSFASIEKFVETFKESFKQLDFLVNNAGVADPTGPSLTKDGFNQIIGVNYLGTALLTSLLLTTMSKEGRIVNVSSNSAFHGLSYIRWKDEIKLPDEGTMQSLGSYSFSKLLLSIWTHILADKLKKTDIKIYSIHPGVVGTNIFNPLPDFIVWGLKKVIKNPEEGVAPIMYCLLEPSIGQANGHFIWEDCTDHDQEFSKYLSTSTVDLHAQVWRETTRWLSGHFDFEACNLLH